MLHQSVKLKLQHGPRKQLINFLRPTKPVYSSSFSLRQTAKSVAILHMASFAPVRSQQILHPSHLNQLCQRATRTGRFFFSRANTANTFSDIVESFPVFVSVSFGELGKQCRNRVFQKNTLPLSSFSEQVQVSEFN